MHMPQPNLEHNNIWTKMNEKLTVGGLGRAVRLILIDALYFDSYDLIKVFNVKTLGGGYCGLWMMFRLDTRLIGPASPSMAALSCYVQCLSSLLGPQMDLAPIIRCHC